MVGQGVESRTRTSDTARKRSTRTRTTAAGTAASAHGTAGGGTGSTTAAAAAAAGMTTAICGGCACGCTGDIIVLREGADWRCDNGGGDDEGLADERHVSFRADGDHARFLLVFLTSKCYW